MKLNEIIDTDGIDKVADKTNISVENLDSLVNEEFKELNRVKALGFLTILKREYSADVDALESRIKEYFEEHNSQDDGKPILVARDRNKSGSGFMKWLIIFGLLYGLWHLYSSGKLDGVLSNSIENQENILNDNEALKSETSEDNADKIVVKRDEENKTKIDIQSVKSAVVEVEKKSLIDNNTTDVVKVTPDVVEDNKTIESVAIEVKKDANSVEIKTKTVEKTAEETVDESVADDDQEAEIIYTVTVNPVVNLWFGFVNLDTKERKEFMTDESTPFDVAAQRWVLVTGHGRLSVTSELKTLKINDRVKHYFYIDSSEIKEITRKEFKSFKSGGGW